MWSVAYLTLGAALSFGVFAAVCSPTLYHGTSAEGERTRFPERTKFPKLGPSRSRGR
jgi:hypothetical protein